MNSVNLIGRLTRDPEVRHIAESQTAVATFGIAIDRGKKKDGSSAGTDFPSITVFGRQAENCERHTGKGLLIGVSGRLQTGSYTNKEGRKIYTTDVIANRVDFLEWKDSGNRNNSGANSGEQSSDIPEGFRATDEDIPF